MMREAFDRRRKIIVAMLSEIPGVVCPEPLGAFYAYPSVKGLLGKEIRGRRPASSVELAELALEEAEVAVVPGEAFGTPGYLRLSYALGDDDLVEGVSRLQKLLRRGDRLTRRLSRHLHAQTSPGRRESRDARPAVAAEGPPAPALHRGDAARDDARPRAASTGCGCPTRCWTRLPSGCRPRTSAAGSGSSGCTTTPATSSARRPTYAGSSTRSPRTKQPTGPAGWRSRWTPAATPPASTA